jgi:hypothetical protein
VQHTPYRVPSTGFVPVLPRHKLRDRKRVDGGPQRREDGALLYISPGLVCRRKPGAVAGSATDSDDRITHIPKVRFA